MLFDKVTVQGTYLEVYEIQNNARSYLKCAILCARRTPTCQAFYYHPIDRTCELHREGAVLVGASNMNVLQLKVTDVFHTITNGGRQSLVYASSEEKTYSDARAQCQSMGGYLIEFDSPEEYDVVLDWVIDISSGSISFVGFNDIAVEDEWVTDRDNNTPVIPENLLWYSDWPDNKDGDEDCGVVFHMKPSWLGDISCSRNELYLCEKDV